MVFARLVWPASLAVLGITAAGSLLNGQRMCVRVLESPGVAGQLEGLHQILSLLQ